MTEGASPPVAAYQCSRCTARYVRQDHLQRHELSHDGRKSSTCEFCSAQFHRRDVLRRHYKTCRQRGDRPIPSTQSRGRRKQSCDRCAINKLACDLDRPCQACASKNLVCSWTRVQASHPARAVVAIQPRQSSATPAVSPSPSEDSPSPFEATGEITQETRIPSPIPEPQLRQCFALQNVPVPFLFNFVNLESRTLVDTFGYSSIAPESLPVSSSSPPTSSNQRSWDYPGERGGELRPLSPVVANLNHIHTAMDYGMRVFRTGSGSSSNLPNPSFLGDLNSNSFNVPGQGSLLDGMSGDVLRDSHSPESTSLPDPTRRRLSELVMQLTNIYITLPKGHPARAASIKIKDADKFFTVSNFHTFTHTYFHHFYPHCPIIHRPSFNLKTAPLNLILVVCLAGALYSSVQEAIIMAQGLLDVAEEYIFRDPHFEQLAKGNFSVEASQACASVQSAVTITMLQNWEGNGAARRRVRTERFGGIVSSARSLRLTSMQSQFFASSASRHSFDWELFVANETFLRVGYYIFILDTGFCIFYNYSPRLALAEITSDMPYSEDTYAATSSADCFQKACDENIVQRRTLSPILKLLLNDDFGEEATGYLTKLTTLQYFIVLKALHIIIWTARANVLGSVLNNTADRALNRWKTLWEAHRKQISPRHFKRLGFIRNASEYWWLAKLLLYVEEHGIESQLGDGGDRFVCAPFEDDQMGYIRFLLQRFSPLGALDIT